MAAMAFSRQSGRMWIPGTRCTAGMAFSGAKAMPAYSSMGMSLAWSPTQQTFSCRTPSSSARRRTMPPLLAPRAVISSRFTAEATTSYSRLQSWARMASSSCRSRWGSSSNSSLEIGDGAWSRLAICWEGVWVRCRWRAVISLGFTTWMELSS